MSIGDNLNTEDICKAWPAIVSKRAEDEVFTLLIEDQYSRYHLCIEVCLDLLDRKALSARNCEILATGRRVEVYNWSSELYRETRFKRVLYLWKGIFFMPSAPTKTSIHNFSPTIILFSVP